MGRKKKRDNKGECNDVQNRKHNAQRLLFVSGKCVRITGYLISLQKSVSTFVPPSFD